MALAEVDRRPKEQQVITQWGFKILLPDDFASFKEAVQGLKPAGNEDEPLTLGSCNFQVPYPIGRISVGIERCDDGASLLAFINPSWLRGEHILDFIQQKSCLKVPQRSGNSLTIVGNNILAEVKSVTKPNDPSVFPPYGEQIIIKSEKIPIGDGWPLSEGFSNFAACTEKIVDSIFAMTGKPCPSGKAISLEFYR